MDRDGPRLPDPGERAEVRRRDIGPSVSDDVARCQGRGQHTRTEVERPREVRGIRPCERLVRQSDPGKNRKQTHPEADQDDEPKAELHWVEVGGARAHAEIVPLSSEAPAWIYEAVCDHEAGTWTAADLSTLRKSIAAGVIPTVASLAASDRPWGHAVFDFIASEYGKEAIRRYLIAVNNREVPVDSARVAFGIEAGDFDRAFQMYARTRFGAR